MKKKTKTKNVQNIYESLIVSKVICLNLFKIFRFCDQLSWKLKSIIKTYKIKNNKNFKLVQQVS